MGNGKRWDLGVLLPVEGAYQYIKNTNFLVEEPCRNLNFTISWSYNFGQVTASLNFSFFSTKQVHEEKSTFVNCKVLFSLLCWEGHFEDLYPKMTKLTWTVWLSCPQMPPPPWVCCLQRGSCNCHLECRNGNAHWLKFTESCKWFLTDSHSERAGFLW